MGGCINGVFKFFRALFILRLIRRLFRMIR